MSVCMCTCLLCEHLSVDVSLLCVYSYVCNFFYSVCVCVCVCVCCVCVCVCVYICVSVYLSLCVCMCVCVCVWVCVCLCVCVYVLCVCVCVCVCVYVCVVCVWLSMYPFFECVHLYHLTCLRVVLALAVFGSIAQHHWQCTYV